MENLMFDSILKELKVLNEHLNNVDAENKNTSLLIDARFNTLEEFVLSIQKDIVDIQNRMTTFKNTLSDIQNRMTTFENTLSDIQNRMTTFENTLSDIQNRMLQFEERLNSLEKITLRMEYTFNDKISALFDANSYQNDQYLKLDKHIRQNEIKIEKLYDHL